MRVTVVGMGHVGAVTAACLARDGHRVTCLDADPARLDAVRRGRAPVDEPGLNGLFAEGARSGELRAAAHLAPALAQADLVIVAVGTPALPDGSPDLGQVERAGRAIGENLPYRAELPVAVLRSTVPPGTTETVFRQAILAGSGGRPVPVAHLPEFFREGSAILDWREGPFVVIGCDEEAAGLKVAELFQQAGPAVQRTGLRTAEALKYACNAWHATKVAFANEIGRWAAASGAQPGELARLFLSDRKLNLGAAYLQPGFAYGGPCLAKDLAALTVHAQGLGLDLPLLSHTQAANRATMEWWARQVRQSGARQVAILGLAHRSGSRDLRASPYLQLARILEGEGIGTMLYEPALREPPPLDVAITGRLEDALDGADLILRSREEIVSGDLIRKIAPKVRVLDLFRIGESVRDEPA
ncbi:nucleotide sugar dehydrogenase [Geminicoccus roseus]|uniref:nucleotide sugar dehydrogenase n=1 Tax=Geminicoccus roseus TaxID=404900 RepID=UPI00040C7558|nr:nucleotide sugar dehydrogenase [Geminicoccus roseus]